LRMSGIGHESRVFIEKDRFCFFKRNAMLLTAVRLIVE